MADNQLKRTDGIEHSVCANFAQSSHLEWLQTNQTGAFAMGTVAGVNTRRYHGLLIASLNPPSDRYCILSRLEELVEDEDQSFNLATVQYPGLVSPAGYQFIESFSASPHPTWRFRRANLTLEKSVTLIDGQQAVTICYRANKDIRLTIRVFVSFRDYHGLTKENSSLNPNVYQDQSRLSIQPYADLPPLIIHHGNSVFKADGMWFKDHEYLRELERGLDYREDLFSPGIFFFNVTAGEDFELTAAIGNTILNDNDKAKEFTHPLTRALDQFRVSRMDGRPTLIAGYPWFTDWSRDTLISLPALIASGFAPAETRSILQFLLAERKQGILPNRFSDRQSAPEYNTVDASLWFFIAAQEYIKATEDQAFLAETLFPAALDIIAWHRRGTFYGIQVDPTDHLLAAGEEGTQLTWMDAKIGDHVVTPRIGKPVEINALWFNALQIAADWAARLGKIEESRQFLRDAAEVEKSFSDNFWSGNLGYLYDVVTPSGGDASLRPNQLFALSLPYPLLDRQRARLIMKEVQTSLLTPCGLRTLAPSDLRYRPRFEGDMKSRDSAYHQGTVWPWLIGPYVNAFLYAFNDSADARDHCQQAVDSILRLLADYCLGSIGEVYDGDPPHNAGGCPAQLWSIAQVVLARRRIAEI